MAAAANPARPSCPVRGHPQRRLHRHPPLVRSRCVTVLTRAASNRSLTRPYCAPSRGPYELAPGSGLNGCSVTQQVPCGWWFVLSLHWDDGGTLLWILTTWYWVGP